MNILVRVVNLLCCISAGLSGGVGGNMHVLEQNSQHPPAQPPWRKCSGILPSMRKSGVRISDAIPKEMFHFPNAKGSAIKK